MDKTITLNNIFQSIVGAFSAIIFFVTVRSSPGPFFDYKMGVIISGVWIYLLYHSAKKTINMHISHFILNILVTYIISGYMCVLFGLMETSHLFSWAYFGSPAAVGFWVGLPFAILFDAFDNTSLLDKYYIRKWK